MKLKVISPFFTDRLYKKGEIIEGKEPVLGITVPAYEEPVAVEEETEEKPKKRRSKAKS